MISNTGGGIAAWSIRHPVGVIMITLAIMLLGVFSLGRLSVDLLPHIIYPDIRVRINNPGVPATIMEDQVTRQLEEQLAITEDVINIESSSSEGRSRINMSFQYGKDIDVALRDASTRLDRAKRFLPDGVDPPIIFKRDPSQRPVAEFVVSSGLRTPIELRNWTDDVFRKWLLNLPGVASAEVGGGLVREIQVLPDQQRLAGLGLTTDDIITALREGNKEEPAGRIKLQQRELSGRISARFESIEEISGLPILLKDGQHVYLRDVARVIDTHEDERLRVRLNSIPGIKISIQKQPNANSVNVVDLVKQRLTELTDQGVIPNDISIDIIGDQSIYIRNSLHHASAAAISGALLAMLVVYLFLGNLKRTLIIGSAIPIAITVTFLIMEAGGLSLNIMTLGGLAVGIGMLVDSTIVMLENIYRHQKEGENNFVAGTHAAREVNGAIVASTSTNLAAIIPFLFIGGLVGLFFRELIFTITAAIVAAMLVALTLVPALAARLQQTPQSERNNWVDRQMLNLQEHYRKVVHYVIHKSASRISLILLLLIALGFSIPSFISDSTEFFPKMDDGRIGVRVLADPGVKLQLTDEATTKVESLIQELPYVKTVFTISGGSIYGRTEIEARNRARIDVQLVPVTQRDMSSEEWRHRFYALLDKNKIPGVRVQAYKLRTPGTYFHRGDDDISLRISGSDLDILDEVGFSLINQLGTIKGVENLTHSSEETAQELSIKIDRERAVNLGFTVEQISRIVGTAIRGTVVSDFIEGDRAYNIRIRLPESTTSSLNKLASLLLGTAPSKQSPVYLADVASIDLIESPSVILRENQQRIVKVTGKIDETYATGEVLEAVNRMLKDFELPEGYQIYDAGISTVIQGSQNTVSQLLGLALFLVLVVMAVQYESLRNPFIIMLGVPFALIGVALGIYWGELPLSMPLWLGVIMLAGIVVNNAIVMLEYIEILRTEGQELEDAISNAAMLRLRPILMTSLTTIVGLVPLATGLGEGSEMLQPLAITIISGLSFSLLVSLFLIPVLYRLFHSTKKPLNNSPS